MKGVLFMGAIALLLIGCQNQGTSDASKNDSTGTVAAEAEKIDYAYVPADHSPDYWDRGDQKNVAFVLNSLKAFENNNIDECITAFADSVTLSLDGYDKKISKDTLKALFAQYRTNYPQLQVKMRDYEAVVSKDKKVQWVSLWYNEINTDRKGKVDSVIKMTDLKIENGKIIVLDEKKRRFPAKK